MQEWGLERTRTSGWLGRAVDDRCLAAQVSMAPTTTRPPPSACPMPAARSPSLFPAGLARALPTVAGSEAGTRPLRRAGYRPPPHRPACTFPRKVKSVPRANAPRARQAPVGPAGRSASAPMHAAISALDCGSLRSPREARVAPSWCRVFTARQVSPQAAVREAFRLPILGCVIR